jgi:hypothetical protein
MVPIDRKRLFIGGVSDSDFWFSSPDLPSTNRHQSCRPIAIFFDTYANIDQGRRRPSHFSLPRMPKSPLFDKNPQAGIFATIT